MTSGRENTLKIFWLKRIVSFLPTLFHTISVLLFKLNTTLWSFLKYYHPNYITWLVAAKERKLATHSVVRMPLFKSMTTNSLVRVRIVAQHLQLNIHLVEMLLWKNKTSFNSIIKTLIRHLHLIYSKDICNTFYHDQDFFHYYSISPHTIIIITAYYN